MKEITYNSSSNKNARYCLYTVKLPNKQFTEENSIINIKGHIYYTYI